MAEVPQAVFQPPEEPIKDEPAMDPRVQILPEYREAWAEEVAATRNLLAGHQPRMPVRELDDVERALLRDA